jgi:putative ABC transport system permease protein
VLYDARAFTQHLDNNLFLQRAPMQLLGVLGPLALALAAIGLYAVLAFAVAQRTQEIGVRLTLGATPASVVALIVREGMKVVLVGAALGWVVAFALGWFLREKLVGVSALEPVVYLDVPALLLGVAALACWLPARRAAKIDPMAALRAE